MITIELSGANGPLFDGKVSRVGNSWRIGVEGQEGFDIVARNARKIALDTPTNERDEVLITGVAPRWVALAVLSSVRPFFRTVKHYDGKNLIELPPYEQPPEDLQSDPE